MSCGELNVSIRISSRSEESDDDDGAKPMEKTPSSRLTAQNDGDVSQPGCRFLPGLKAIASALENQGEGEMQNGVELDELMAQPIKNLQQPIYDQELAVGKEICRHEFRIALRNRLRSFEHRRQRAAGTLYYTFPLPRQRRPPSGGMPTIELLNRSLTRYACNHLGM